jgi:hypothetical protein
LEFNTGSRKGRGPRKTGEAGFDLSDPVRSFLRTLPAVLFSPRGFFCDIAFRRGFLNPLVFAVLCTLIGAVLAGLFGELARGVAGLEWLASQMGFLPTVLVIFASRMVGLFIGTGVYHLLVMLIAGRNSSGLEGTFMVVSYAYAVQVVTWVPLLNILFGLYGLYLCAFGFQVVHSTTYQRAATIAGLPLLVLVVGGLLFGILLGYLLSAA